MKINFQPIKDQEKGQSMVEFSMGLVVLLWLLVGAIDFGWAFFTMVTLQDAAQEGAAYAAICPADTAGIEARLRASASQPIDLSTLTVDQIDICVMYPGSETCGAPLQIGNNVRVTVTFPHQVITPGLGTVLDAQQYDLTVDATDTILRTNCP